VKVAFISSLYHPNGIGGAEVTVRLIAEGLVRAGHAATVISLAPDGIERVGEEGGVRTVYLPLANLYWQHGPVRRGLAAKLAWHLVEGYNPVMGRRLRRVLAVEQPDVVHAHNIEGFSAAAWTAARRLGLPVVQTVHDYYLACPRCTMLRGQRNCVGQCADCRLLTGARRALSDIPAAVTAVSQRVLQRLSRAGLFAGVSRQVVIPGCNHAMADPPPRADLPPGTRLRLGYFGRLEPVIKGLELLLDAVATLPEDRVLLRIGGRGSDPFVADLRARHGGRNVEFLGFTDPATFFAGIDLLVVPSLWEDPLPRVVHEAFAFGVPVLGADVGGLPEMIDPGVTGDLFRHGDVVALRAAIERLVEQGLRAGRLFGNCRARAADFAFERIYGLYWDVLQDAATTALPQRRYRESVVAREAGAGVGPGVGLGG
jgi:glycosyltransferase involved in cell wall biosynthesis